MVIYWGGGDGVGCLGVAFSCFLDLQLGLALAKRLFFDSRWDQPQTDVVVRWVGWYMAKTCRILRVECNA